LYGKLPQEFLKAGVKAPVSESKRHEHDRLQKSYFDQRSDWFKQPIPAEIEERTRLIVEAAELSASSRVLDVGTGTGVLIPHCLACGAQQDNIFGCDLSGRMLTEAKARFPRVTFWQGDILDFPAEHGLFQAVFFNACFANIFDPERAIKVTSNLLAPAGRIIISHPLGSQFVASLHAQEPEIVPFLLPDRELLSQWCAATGLELAKYRDEPLLYLAVLKRSC